MYCAIADLTFNRRVRGVRACVLLRRQCRQRLRRLHGSAAPQLLLQAAAEAASTVAAAAAAAAAAAVAPVSRAAAVLPAALTARRRWKRSAKHWARSGYRWLTSRRPWPRLSVRLRVLFTLLLRAEERLGTAGLTTKAAVAWSWRVASPALKLRLRTHRKATLLPDMRSRVLVSLPPSLSASFFFSISLDTMTLFFWGGGAHIHAASSS